MTLTNEATAADVKAALFSVIEELSEERVAEVLDFALFIQTRQKPATRPEFTYKQIEENSSISLARTIAALQEDRTQGRLYDRLMAERAEE
ncbi:MAG: hypothetical protein WHX52_13690 [Anaerolineae bacterium]